MKKAKSPKTKPEVLTKAKAKARLEGVAVILGTAIKLLWDATPDGKRFLRAVPLGANAAPPFNVVPNWTSTFKK